MESNRRRFLVFCSGLGLVGGFGSLVARDSGAAQPGSPERFKVNYTDEQWHARLTPEQYRVLRQEGTERPFSSPLNAEHRAGVFACAGCELELFSSATKYDSHTGWPSFWQPLPDAVISHEDTSLGMSRVEVRCKRCGGHLGHVFEDGPKPTGLRYCMNGVAMNFRPVPS